MADDGLNLIQILARALFAIALVSYLGPAWRHASGTSTDRRQAQATYSLALTPPEFAIHSDVIACYTR
jgi:hypothetical protein